MNAKQKDKATKSNGQPIIKDGVGLKFLRSLRRTAMKVKTHAIDPLEQVISFNIPTESETKKKGRN